METTNQNEVMDLMELVDGKNATSEEPNHPAPTSTHTLEQVSEALNPKSYNTEPTTTTTVPTSTQSDDVEEEVIPGTEEQLLPDGTDQRITSVVTLPKDVSKIPPTDKPPIYIWRVTKDGCQKVIIEKYEVDRTKKDPVYKFDWNFSTMMLTYTVKSSYFDRFVYGKVHSFTNDDDAAIKLMRDTLNANISYYENEIKKAEILLNQVTSLNDSCSQISQSTQSTQPPQPPKSEESEKSPTPHTDQ